MGIRNIGLRVREIDPFKIVPVILMHFWAGWIGYSFASVVRITFPKVPLAFWISWIVIYITCIMAIDIIITRSRR